MGVFQHSVVGREESVIMHQVLTALHGDNLLISTTNTFVCQPMPPRYDIPFRVSSSSILHSKPRHHIDFGTGLQTLDHIEVLAYPLRRAPNKYAGAQCHLYIPMPIRLLQV